MTNANNALVQMNMQAAADEIDLSDDALLASMLEGIAPEDEAPAAGLVEVGDDDAIEAAVAEIEKAEAVQEHYAADESESSDEIPVTPVDAEPAKPAKTKKEKKAKEPAAPRTSYNGRRTNADQVLKAKLGDKLSETMILEVEDAALEPSVLEAKQAELLALLNKRPGTDDGASSQQKVAEKIVMLFSWLKNGGTLNKVMELTFKVLARDGQIVSGAKGNLYAELLAKPYSTGTCNAQSGQMMAMLPLLKIANKTEKGTLVANPNSMILMAAKAQLGL